MMHFHYSQSGFLMIWLGCSFINWFFLMGEYNHKFRTKLEHDEGAKWTIVASLFAGINGLLVTLIAHRGKHIAWRPITQKEKDQLLMLKMLENDSYQSTSGDMMNAGGYSQRPRVRGVKVAV